tara:strand:+ start:151 stop:351 length:201 start_codon:yes stop_codon:yes gene_type:complete
VGIEYDEDVEKPRDKFLLDKARDHVNYCIDRGYLDPKLSEVTISRFYNKLEADEKKKREVLKNASN